MRVRRRDAYLPSLVAAVCLTLAAAGLGLFAGATFEEHTLTGNPPVSPPGSTTAPGGSSTTVLVDDDVALPGSTTVGETTSPGNKDFRSAFLDTDDMGAVIDAWRTAEGRSRHRMNWTGSISSCRAGDTSMEFKIDVLTRVQWFRAMAGVSPAIRLNLETSRLAQEAALVMAAAGDLSHEPDGDWPCYSEDAYTGASHSNLFLGEFGVDAVDGYIEDSGSDNIKVGHRRWILDPTLTSIGTGDTRESNALFVINEETIESAGVREPEGFVMWPPRGYVPRSQIYERWSISHRSADFSDAVVTVVHEGRTRVFRDPHADSEGYGSLHTLVFEWRRPGKGTGPVRIRVDKIELAGTLQTFQYEVKPIG